MLQFRHNLSLLSSSTHILQHLVLDDQETRNNVGNDRYLPMFIYSDNNLPHVQTHILGHTSMTLHPISKGEAKLSPFLMLTLSTHRQTHFS